MKVSTKKSQAKTANINSLQSAIDLEGQIRRRAYELYEQRGRQAGHDTEDWLEAEAELAPKSTKLLPAEAVRKNRKPPVTSTGKTKAKQVKKSRSSSQSKTEEEARNGH